MNGMNFKPFITKVLDSLSDEDLGTLTSLINTHSNSFINRSLIDGEITSSDKGVHLATILLDKQTIKSGYLIYNNSYCVLLSFNSNSERVSEYQIDVSNKLYNFVKEYVTTDWLRHEITIKGISSGEIGSIIAKYEVTDITHLTKEQLDDLEPGDVVNKKTGKAIHSYHVSYKGEGAGQGICLTYSAAGYIETVSYDRSGSNWVYNSTDVMNIPTQPSNGTYLLKSINGTLTWVVEE